MTGGTFGDLLDAAGRNLQSASRLAAARLGEESAVAALGQAGRVAAALSRFLDDMLLDQADLIIENRAGETVPAAVHARDALRMAAASLTAADTSVVAASVPDEPSARLAEAVACLKVGRDLLRTHFATDGAGLRWPASDWAAVVTSAAIRRALLDEVGRQTLQLKVLVGQMSSAAEGPGVPAAVREEFVTADHHLLLADMAIETSLRGHRGSAADDMLLRAIPGNFVPDQMPLVGGEPVDVLCAGATVSAIRLRIAVRAGRLYVPTRSLPDGYDVPRRFATAPGPDTFALLCAYDAGIEASTQLAAALGDAAIAAQAPSARQANTAQAPERVRLRSVVAEPARHRRGGAGHCRCDRRDRLRRAAGVLTRAPGHTTGGRCARSHRDRGPQPFDGRADRGHAPATAKLTE